MAGLKVIAGHIDVSCFRVCGRKRRGRPEGHRYGDQLLDYRQARRLIYVPTYRWMVCHAPLAREVAIELLRAGQSQELYLYDFEINPDIDNMRRPLSHAAVLIQRNRTEGVREIVAAAV